MSRHEYNALNVVSGFITAGGYLVLLAGVGGGIFSVVQGAILEGAGLILVGLVVGLFYLAFGEALEALRQIAINSAGPAAPAATHPAGLTQHDVYTAMLAALRESREAAEDERPLERRPDPISDDAVSSMLREDAPSTPSAATASRSVTCPACRRTIKIAANSRFRPGSVATCPGCRQAIHV